MRFLFLSTSLAACVAAGPALAADVVVHRTGSTFEDGIPGLDPDVTNVCSAAVCVGGTRNGLFCNKDADCPDPKDDKLRWEAGSIHVASDNYTVSGPFDSGINGYRPFQLVIEPGAIVKVSSTCTTDSNDTIVACYPTTYGGGQLYVSDGSTLIAEEATITDIRDDLVGGDTNNDGTTTAPAPSYLLRFGGSPDEILTGSTVKYAALVGHFGSMLVQDNTFLQMGGAGSYQGSSIYNTHPPVRGSVPQIIENYFEIVAGTSGPGALDVRGQSAVVWGNEFTGNAGSVVIGPTWENLYEYRNALPEDGVTIVAHNDISSKEGIVTAPATATSDTILQQVRFRADIRDNRIVRPNVAAGNVGLSLALFSETTATNNTVENYAYPFQLRLTGVAFPPSADTAALIELDVHANSFSVTGAQTGPVQFYEAFWKDFLRFVDAENNWWGHLTGPKDTSNTDGLANPRGLGLAVNNGIDYAPFLAGEASAPLDSIQLDASAFPPPPLVPDTGEVVLNVAVDDYTLVSAATGTVTVTVRDTQGYDLVPPVAKTVKATDHTVAFDPIALPSVPRFTSAVVVEAALVPNSSSRDEVRSKPKLFSVARPKGYFWLQCLDDADVGGNCDRVTLQPGNTSNLGFRFGYKSAGTVHGHLSIEEQTRIGHEVVRAFPTIHFTAPPSTFGATISQYASYLPPLAPATDPSLALVLRYWAEDDGGIEIANGTRTLPVFGANYVTPRVSFFDAAGYENPIQYSHLKVGDHLRLQMDLSYSIGTKNVTNWQIRTTPIQARNKDDVVLHTYESGPAVLLDNRSTGTGESKDREIDLRAQPALPSGTTSVQFRVELFAPNEGIVVSGPLVYIIVVDPDFVVTKPVPSGASSTSFPPTDVELNVGTNGTAGTVTVEEFFGAISKLTSAPNLRRPSSFASEAAQTRLIPLERHYSIHDTLPDAGLSATVKFHYDPNTDFPDEPGFDEDALVVAARNPLSGELEALPSTHDDVAHTVSASYDGFFGFWTVASQTTAPAASCADPTADGKTTASDALRALRTSVGSAECAACVCDVNKNGSVSATDALIILKVAVGQLATPTCLPCS